MNLLSGQTVYLTAVVTQPMRYIAVDRDELRPLLFEDGPLGDLLLSTFMARREALQQRGRRDGDRRSALLGADAADRRVRAAQPPARSPGATPSTPADPEAAALIAALDPDELPLVRLPGRTGAAQPVRRRGVARARDRARARAARGGRPRDRSAAARPVWARPCTAPRRVWTRSSSRAPRSAGRRARRGGSRTTSASRPGSAASELTSRAVTQARKFNARTATPYRALALEPGRDRHIVRLEDDHEIAARAVVLATGRRLPPAAGRRPRRVRGHQRLLRGRPARGAAVRRHAGRRDRRRQLGRRRRRSGSRAAARS